MLTLNDYLQKNLIIPSDYVENEIFKSSYSSAQTPNHYSDSKKEQGFRSIIERRRFIKKLDHINYQSSPQKYFYVLNSGCCKGYYIDITGREHVTNFYFSGDIIGLESLFSGTFLINIIALTDCHISYINISKFKQLNYNDPEIVERLINLFSKQLWQANSMKGSYNAQELVIQFLLILSNHPQSFGYSKSYLTLPMGRKDIGNFLGLSSETVSRVITHLKEAKLIEVKRNIIKLCNLKRLNQLASNSDIINIHRT